MTTAEFNLLIKNRRSVFQTAYTGERVDDQVIEQMLINANWAPTHKFTEPWRFVVYTGEGLKKLATTQAEYYKQITQKDNSYKEERYQNLLTKPMQSSHIIVVGMHRDKNKSVPLNEELGAVFCAIENMYLTATAYQIGCYLSTGGITYFEGAQKLFGWEKEDILVGFLHVGIPKNRLPEGKRGSVMDKVTWISS